MTSLDGYQRRHRWVGFPLAVIYKFADDQGPYLAALITYYGFLSLFPLLLLLVTVLGFVLQNDPGLQEQLLDSALAQFPVIGGQLRDNVHSLKGNGADWRSDRAHPVRLSRRRRRGPERVQPRLGRAAQPASEPDHRPPAQPAAAARPGRRGPRHDRARRADHRRGRLRRRRRRRARVVAILLAVIANVGLFMLVFRVLTASEVPHARPAHRRRAAGVGWQVVQVLGTYFVTHMLRGRRRPTASSASCSG